MSWIHKFRVIGKPTITGDKPGSQLEKVLAEIQSKAITLIEADNKAASGGAANVNIKLRRIKNDVTISATVDMPELGNVLPGGGGLTVAGTPELFKVCALTGWTLDSEGAWTQMSISAMVASPPTTLWSGQTEAGNYLRPTWDWVRAYEDD